MKFSSIDNLPIIKDKNFRIYRLSKHDPSETRRDFKSFHIVKLIIIVYFPFYLDEKMTLDEFKNTIEPLIKKDSWLILELDNGKKEAIGIF